MDEYRLAIDGDDIEKFCWGKFIQNEFPSYEKFWQLFVTPLTNRPKNIHAKTDSELKQIGKSPHDICLTQLHYTILRHLLRTYLILHSDQPIGMDELTDGVIRLCSALDVSFELLERFTNPTKYDPWLERKDNQGKLGGKEARKQWQQSNNYPLQHLRDYRNHLIHGRLTPGVIGRNYFLPKIETENKYLDWRIITNPNENPGLDTNDLMPAEEILRQAWGEVINYLEEQWQKVLLKQ